MEKEVSCLNTRAIIGYVKRHRPEACDLLLRDLDPEIDRMPNPEAFLSDPNNWVDSRVATEMYRRARHLLEDEAAAYKIARYAVKHTKLGYAQRIIVKGLWSTRSALKHAQKINNKWNRTKRIELVSLNKTSAIIRLHWNETMSVTKDLCLMNQGTYVGLPAIWGGEPNSLQETQCYFDGAPFCEYHLKWPFRNRIFEFFSKIFSSKSVLMETIKEMEADKKIIEQKYEEVNELNKKLSHKIDQLTAIQDTGKAILSILDLDRLLTVIMNLLSNVCRINRALIMLVNEETAHLEYLHAAGFQGEIPEVVQNYRISLDRVSNLLVRVTNTGQSEYIPEVRHSNLRKQNIVLLHGNPSSVFVVPLITRSKVIGVIATDGTDGAGVPEETRETLEVFAPHIAIAIQNARLYQTLQQQMKELKRSHALLSRTEKFSLLGNLAARLAHEIKNPMTAIQTFIQLLPKKYDDENFRNTFYEIAREETRRVNNLITELLDLVKTRQSHFALDDLHRLIDKMILLMSPQSNAKKITIDCNLDPAIGKVWMDTEKIKQVILNILSNAIDFTPVKGKITVTTRLDMSRGNRAGEVILEIRDSGPGIPEKLVDKIFDPYFTTKHKSDRHNGTGLGLFIAYQNMKDHGGSIEVQNSRKGGAVFILTLPNTPSRKEPNRYAD